MKITRQFVADKIADYLHGNLSQAELVDWAERAVMDAEFDKADTDLSLISSDGLVSPMWLNSDSAGKTAKNFFADLAIARQ